MQVVWEKENALPRTRRARSREKKSETTSKQISSQEENTAFERNKIGFCGRNGPTCQTTPKESSMTRWAWRGRDEWSSVWWVKIGGGGWLA